jgi:hypothetical protein
VDDDADVTRKCEKGI